jgi:hypothetical protein
MLKRRPHDGPSAGDRGCKLLQYRVFRDVTNMRDA